MGVTELTYPQTHPWDMFNTEMQLPEGQAHAPVTT